PKARGGGRRRRRPSGARSNGRCAAPTGRRRCSWGRRRGRARTRASSSAGSATCRPEPRGRRAARAGYHGATRRRLPAGEGLEAGGETLCALVGAGPGAPLRATFSAMAYGEGGRLKLHTDGVGERVVAWSLYLTREEDGEWGAADGGELVLTDRGERSCAVQ